MSGNHLFLPPEIWYQILTKLPVKSILRFRCVCKTWHSTISGPNFISDHPLQKRVLVSRHDTVTKLYKFSSYDESFVESHEHEGMPGNIVGSCDGLICLWEGNRGTGPCRSYGYVQNFLIWNPIIKKIVELPSQFSPSERQRDCLYGFGFDCNGSTDYKVLRVHPKVHHYDFDCQIFDLRKGVWRRLIRPKLPSYSHVEKSRSSVYLHGHLHWIGYDLLSNCVLLSFDLSMEAFRKMEMPCDEDFKEVDWRSCFCFSKVSLINGLLSVGVFRRPARQGCSVWSMKEYGVTESWTKLFHVDLSCRLERQDFVGFTENGELLVLNCGRGNKNKGVLALYNPESGESKALFSAYQLKDVCSYKESLVLL